MDLTQNTEQTSSSTSMGLPGTLVPPFINSVLHNVQSDPEAAKIVFECGALVTMVPLEVTHTALATPTVIQRLSVHSTPFLGLMRKLLLFFAQTYKEVFSFEHPPLHDPLAVFYIACPEAFKVC